MHLSDEIPNIVSNIAPDAVSDIAPDAVAIGGPYTISHRCSHTVAIFPSISLPNIRS